MRFSEFFRLNLSQYELDFVDVPLETDIPLFIDPYAIAVRGVTDPWFALCTNDIVNFFGMILQAIQDGRDSDALTLLRRLPEPNQTHLGLSTGLPAGRSIGNEQSIDLFDRLRASRAVQTGFLNDLEDCELVVPGIGRDKISDIATNIIKRRLLSYTKTQCDALNIPMIPVPQTYWQPEANTWTNDYVELPVTTTLVGHQNVTQPIILVPKLIARLDLSFSHKDYYNNYVINYLQAEELRAGGSLARTLKSGRLRVDKKDMKERHPLAKEFLYSFSTEHTEVLETYKRAVEPSGATSNEDIENRQPEPHEIDIDRFCDELAEIVPGRDAAAVYHRKILGILEALFFYPHLWHFEKEKDVDEGRRRIDISARNGSESGFFAWLRTQYGIFCPYIMIECKNYSEDPANPELNQLNGRLSAQRGMFGILICRTVEDKERMQARCRDFVTGQSHYILVLDDGDICELIHLMKSGGYESVSLHLDTLFSRMLLR